MLVFFVFIMFVGSSSAEFKSSSRVVGGAAVREDQAPYHAALLYFDDNFYGCGGAIIHQFFVLTAAHCFKEAEAEAEDVRVLVGTNDLKKGTDFHQVDKVITHDR